jgi:hypothetical protein
VAREGSQAIRRRRQATAQQFLADLPVEPITSTDEAHREHRLYRLVGACIGWLFRLTEHPSTIEYHLFCLTPNALQI